MLRVAILALVLLVGAVPVSRAEQITSAYTRIDKGCVSGAKDENSAEVICKGLGGLDVIVADADARILIGYMPAGIYRGRESDPRPVYHGLGPFNHTHKVLEWRLEAKGGSRKPFATIHRYHTDQGDPDAKGGFRRGQILVVTRLDESGGCHVAYVDALANRNANSLARKAADELARGFDCSKDKPVKVGKTGKSPM